MPAFQDYQADFTAHLRQPAQHAPPRGVDRKRMRIYTEIVFNQFSTSLQACFPVLRSILGKRIFQHLARQCFSGQTFANPLFQDIPARFVDFLSTHQAADLPPYTTELAHYEWIELALSRELAEAPLPAAAQKALAPGLAHRVSLTAVHRLLHYAFPVHQLSRKQRHLPAADTYLLVYRTPDFQIRFIQLNVITYQLLQQIRLHPATAEQHLLELSQHLPDLPRETLLQFGIETLQTLAAAQAIDVTPAQD